jgi:2-polyprenyl-6-methoxyphenol hydroxylase-like FAD-dependent oxidoreductase
VTLLEAAADLSRGFRGEALMPSGLEALDQLGLLPIASEVPQRPLAGWQVVVEGRSLFQVREPLEGSGQRPCTLVSQPAWLAGLLAEGRRPGSLSLRLDTPVADLWRQGDGRISGVVLADGSVVRADLVLACDGRASLLRRRAGLVLQPAIHPPLDVLWFRFEESAEPLPDGGFTTLVGPAGLASLFRDGSGEAHLGWAVPAAAPTPRLAPGAWIEQLASQAPAALAAWLRRHGPLLRGPVRFSVQVGIAERWWKPGLLLLGDAAHPMSPVRAQGINMALRDAAVAAAALAGRAAPGEIDAALATIEAQRRPEVERLQALQAAELERGLLLLQWPRLRRLLVALAPLLGGAIGHHWQRQQRELRLGLTGRVARR